MLAADLLLQRLHEPGAGILTIDKGIGALAVMAWRLDWAVNRRPILGTRQLWLSAHSCCGPACRSGRARSIDKAALVTSLRYLTFAILVLSGHPVGQGDRRRADVLVSC